MDVLLLEPAYYTQYPPLALLKISTYHKRLGDTVQYLRGTAGLRFLPNAPDRVYVTSLFTWAWKPVQEAVRMSRLYFPTSEILLGGIYASLMTDHAKTLGADRVVPGIWPELESLLPDYSLVPNWEKSSILFTHRGCKNRCEFCAVPALEGKPQRYCKDVSIRDLVHPDHKKVILWDNNILAEPHWKSVVDEIKEMNLEVDFNQGLDARRINEEVAESFRGLKMPIIRLAYDHPGMGAKVKRAIELLDGAGFSRRKILSYVIFNFKDTPEQLFERVRDLLSWGTSAYPMRYQPLDALEKDTYVAPKWSEELLDLVARARRVFGKGGAFPPYEGLIKKFLDAKDFAEAFSVWADGIAQKNKSFANETEPKTIVFRNYTIAVQDSDKAWSRKTDRVIDKYRAAGAEALGGKHAILVTNRGRAKKISLLGVYRSISGEHEIPMDKGERVVSVITEFDTKDYLYMVSRNGRLGAFPAESIGSKSLDAPFAKRLELDDDDEVASVVSCGINKQLFILSRYGWLRITPANTVHVYSGSGRGELIEFPFKRSANVQFAAAVNGNGFRVHVTTNKDRKVHKYIDLTVPYESVSRIVEVTRGETVAEVNIK
jgi:hypothetical protein